MTRLDDNPSLRYETNTMIFLYGDQEKYSNVCSSPSFPNPMSISVTRCTPYRVDTALSVYHRLLCHYHLSSCVYIPQYLHVFLEYQFVRQDRRLSTNVVSCSTAPGMSPSQAPTSTSIHPFRRQRISPSFSSQLRSSFPPSLPNTVRPVSSSEYSSIALSRIRQYLHIPV